MKTTSIGVDVGGTKIAAALVAGGGGVIARTSARTEASRPGRVVLEDAVAAAEAMAAEAARRGLEVDGVGVGVPEIVDPAGRIVTDSVIGWLGEPVEQSFSHLGRVTIVADVRAAALGEAVLGAGRGYRTFAYVTVGTGISHTLVVDGQPYAGARGAALLLGSGRLGDVVLEEVACGPAIAAAAGAASAEEVLAAAEAGDVEAARVVDGAGARARRGDRHAGQPPRPRGGRRRRRARHGRRELLGRRRHGGTAGDLAPVRPRPADRARRAGDRRRRVRRRAGHPATVFARQP